MPVTVIQYLKYEHHTLCFLRPYIFCNIYVLWFVRTMASRQ